MSTALSLITGTPPSAFDSLLSTPQKANKNEQQNKTNKTKQNKTR
jgi:hypothetical protein